MPRKKPTTVGMVVEDYVKSLSYDKLSDNTQRDYTYFISICCGASPHGTDLYDHKVRTLTTPMVQKAYNEWAKRGVPTANHTRSVMSRVFNYGIKVGLCMHNPFTHIEKLSHRTRQEVWTQEQIKQFLDTAYSKFEWRSVGLIVHMAYTWCQRLGDMTNLKFDNYSFEDQVLKLEQSKRRARVELPTPDSLHKILVQQHKDMGFQPYIAPRIAYGKIQEKPYDKVMLGTIARNIRNKAGLPDNLWIMDMRRTGTTEMVEASVPLPQIMSVTGHANAQSLKPYMKNTLTSSSEAYKLRIATGKGDIL